MECLTCADFALLFDRNRVIKMILEKICHIFWQAWDSVSRASVDPVSSVDPSSVRECVVSSVIPEE